MLAAYTLIRESGPNIGTRIFIPVTNPLQLHLFDASPDPATIPLDRRRRLLTLTGALLSEAARDMTDLEDPSAARGTHDE